MISNSVNATKLLNVFMGSEPVPEEDEIVDGVYVGKTLLYNLPFFLNSSKLMNPHISIVGMTGSGKSYLLKSMIMRLFLTRKVSIFIIDWVSEYSDLVKELGGIVEHCSDGKAFDAELLKPGISSVDLSNIADSSAAGLLGRDILIYISKMMSRSKLNEKISWVIVIDEAWKLAEYEKVLGRLFREGRKFGFSIIVATQLMKDVNNEILANAACSFVFRVLGSNNFDALISSGLLRGKDVEIVKGLKRGMCVVSMSRRGKPSCTFAVKVEGFSLGLHLLLDRGVQMRLSKEEIAAEISKMQLGPEIALKLFRFFEEAGMNLDLAQVTGAMLGIGMNRVEIISFLSDLGVDEESVAMSIEYSKGVRIVE